MAKRDDQFGARMPKRRGTDTKHQSSRLRPICTMPRFQVDQGYPPISQRVPLHDLDCLEQVGKDVIQAMTYDAFC